MTFKIHKNFLRVRVNKKSETETLKTCGGVIWIQEKYYFLCPLQVSFIKNFIIAFKLQCPELNNLLNTCIVRDRYNAKIIRECDYYRKNIKVPTPIDSYGSFAEGMRHAQKVSLYGSLCIDRFGLFLDRGIGKSKVAIDNFTLRLMEDKIKTILIVCPRLNITNTWVPEIKKHCKIKIPVVSIVGSKKEKQSLIRNESREFYVHIMTYTALQLYINKLSSYDIVIFDESRDLGTPDSLRSVAALSISSSAKYVIAATGTVNTLKSMRDVFSQYMVLDLGATFGLKHYFFQEEYFVDKGEFYPKWIMKKGSFDRIKCFMYNRAVSYTKEECLDLPKRTVKYTTVTPTEFQRSFTNAFADGLSLMFPDKQLKDLFEREGVDYEEEAAEINEAEPISIVTKLQEITSGFYKFYSMKNKFLFFESSKMTALSDILKSTGDKKGIIWCRFIEDIKSIAKYLEFVGIKSYEMSGKKDEINKWRADSNAKILIGMEQVGRGMTLIEAEFMIYYSYDYKLVNLLQSMDRNYRLGQDKDVIIYMIEQQDTVDQAIILTLNTNARFSKKLTKFQLKKIAKGKVF